MGHDSFGQRFTDEGDRVTGRAVVTGAAKYAAEYEIPGLVYGVLVGSTIAKGTIRAMDTRAAEKAPGILAVITHLNAPRVPGYDEGANPAKGGTNGGGLKIFNDNIIRFNGQPIALVIADTFERAGYAGSLVKAQYDKQQHQTSFPEALKNDKPLEGQRYKDVVRGTADAY